MPARHKGKISGGTQNVGYMYGGESLILGDSSCFKSSSTRQFEAVGWYHILSSNCLGGCIAHKALCRRSDSLSSHTYATLQKQKKNKKKEDKIM